MGNKKRNQHESDDDDDDDDDDEMAGLEMNGVDDDLEDDDVDDDQQRSSSSSSSSSKNANSSSKGNNSAEAAKAKSGKGVAKGKGARRRRQQMITLAEAEEAAQDIENRKIHKDTRGRYESNLRAMASFGEKNFPAALDDNKLVCPMPAPFVSAFFGTLAKAGTAMDRLRGPEELRGDEEKPLSVSHLQGHGSAILWHYTTHGRKRVDDEVALVIKHQVEGYEKLITRLKQKGLYKSNEGRVPLLIGGLIVICMCFAKKVPQQRGADSWISFVFGWSFLTLMWSLMSRSDNVDKLCLHHLRREGDCIVVTEQGSKSDQKGEKVVEKHVYANPYQPVICPFLGLAMITFMRPASGTMQLYPGNDNNENSR